MDHIIPPITDPLGKYWDQPDRSLIEITDNFARMSVETMEKLADCTNSRPTGVYEGKMWRALYYSFRTPTWCLCWFGPSSHPDKCSVNHLPISIIK